MTQSILLLSALLILQLNCNRMVWIYHTLKAIVNKILVLEGRTQPID